MTRPCSPQKPGLEPTGHLERGELKSWFWICPGAPVSQAPPSLSPEQLGMPGSVVAVVRSLLQPREVSILNAVLCCCAFSLLLVLLVVLGGGSVARGGSLVPVVV